MMTFCIDGSTEADGSHRESGRKIFCLPHFVSKIKLRMLFLCNEFKIAYGNKIVLYKSYFQFLNNISKSFFALL